MEQKLQGMRIAILVEKGFEQVELTEPQNALKQAGAQTYIISPQQNSVRAWNRTEWGNEFQVDVPLEEADPNDYDGLLLPGGVMNPDRLRTNRQALRFVQAFFAHRKPVAAICHGPWTLINAGVIAGYTLTSYPSLQVDLENAGASWVNQEVVVDEGLVTSRNTQDIPAFNREMLTTFERGQLKERAVGNVSTAFNQSFSEGAGAGALGFDSPPITSSGLTNEEVRDARPWDPSVS